MVIITLYLFSDALPIPNYNSFWKESVKVKEYCETDYDLTSKIGKKLDWKLTEDVKIVSIFQNLKFVKNLSPKHL